MYKVTFWNFGKKQNSTLQPTGLGAEYSCEVLDGSGMLNPTIKLHTAFVDPSIYTYAKISAWNNRYYFISNWRYDRGLWWADLTIDVLASWKNSIGSWSGYVLRSASQSDGTIKDTFYPAKAEPVQKTKVISLGWQDELSNGTFVVGIINGDTGAVGSVNYYVMTPAQFISFCHAVYDNTNDWLDTGNISDISEELLKTLFNPFEYVTSAMWFPITVPVMPGSAKTSIPMGWWDVPAAATGVLYTEAVPAATYSVTPDPHPQAAIRGAYLNSAPYTTLTLDYQPFGLIPLDASLVCGRQLDLVTYVDYVSGVACLHIQTDVNGDGSLIYSQATQLGVPIQISGRQPNIASMIAAGVASVTEGLASKQGIMADVNHVIKGLTGADISGTVGKIASAAETGFKRLSSLGSNGSRAQILSEAYLSQDYLMLVDELNSDFGRPLYETKQISTLSGYIQCGEGHVNFNCLDQERAMISAYLTTGFFYE